MTPVRSGARGARGGGQGQTTASWASGGAGTVKTQTHPQPIGVSMTNKDTADAVSGEIVTLDAHDVVVKPSDLVDAKDMESRIFKAISVQRPVVVEYLKSLRRDNPEATPAQLLKELEKRYVSTVTVTGAGVGASAAIPGVGVPLALGLGAVDLLFFYETSALYVLAATELHGIEVQDSDRARPLVFGILTGEKSQSKVTKMVLQASGAGSIDQARAVAAGTVGKALPNGWGEVLTTQLPDSALAPLSTVLAKQALKGGARMGAGTLGKVIPFGVGAVVGGVGSYTFGRDVVKAARLAFPTTPSEFPAWLQDYSKPEQGLIKSSRAARALESAVHVASDAGLATWGAAFRGARKVNAKIRSGRKGKQESTPADAGDSED